MRLVYCIVTWRESGNPIMRQHLLESRPTAFVKRAIFAYLYALGASDIRFRKV